MKKTLIAVAALAVVGAASAQVTLSGKFRAAYTWSESTAGVKTNGINVTDGNLIFGATEDLGGGMKLSTSMDVRVRGRDATYDASQVGGSGTVSSGLGGVRARDASMTLSGGFGSVTVGAIEAGNGILGNVNSSGVSLIGLDNNTQLAGASNVDLISWNLPAMGPFSASVSVLDNVGSHGGDSGNTSTGIGFGYAAGPLKVSLDFASYGSAKAAVADHRTRFSGKYDFGQFNVGFGIQQAGNGTAADKRETAIGVGVPMGALNIGAVYASSSTDGTAGSNTGVDMGVQYSLSKTSYVAFQYQTTKTAGAATSANSYRVQLSKGF